MTAQPGGIPAVRPGHPLIPTGRVDYSRRPMLVFWETTRACGLACKHCRASATVQASPGELDTAEGKALIDQVAGFGRPYPILVLTGGDCLLRADLWELVEHAREAGVPIAVSPSVTPALTDEAIARIAGSGVKAVSISLDGACPATHDGVRGIANHFGSTLEAIGKLVAAGLTVQVNTTVMRSNVEELADVAALVAEMGVHVWEVFFLVHVGRGVAEGALTAQEHEDVVNLLWLASHYGYVVRTVEAPFFRRVVVQRRDGGPAPRTALHARLAGRLEKLLGPPRGAPSAHTAATRDGKGILFVSHDGQVYPAGFLPMELGSVREQSLADLYRDHPVLVSVRGARFAGRCGVCEYGDLCGGSRARAYAATGDPLGEDPACAFVPSSPPH